MDDLMFTTETTKDELLSVFDEAETLLDVTSSTIFLVANNLIGYIFKDKPPVVLATSLLDLLQASANVLEDTLHRMEMHNANILTTTTVYEYVGYMPGSSYPTYKAKNISYSYK
ncbi:MAG: hypothetical protein SO083_08580 [Megamonas funiformis]|jgi:hypothetical protein|uniref:hypothetical protein n=1 Tax=Megamonas TaxID=158846 RepID=UPI00195657A4|nr:MULTISPECIES: hypothetical protein [Megamonas]MBM6749228.1 hypothetical protein [Megamonas rupellensis]MDY3875205.1 hypothetical protein [Megamonas funiformis]BDA09039.1 hypothetical protein MU1CBH_00670 [Megamonas funiformis]